MNCERSQDDVNLIKAEFANAAKIATFASQNLDQDSAKTFTSAFISKDLLAVPGNAIVNQLKDSYGRGADIPSTTASDYPLIVTCDNTNRFCGNGYYASMSDSSKTMNLCNAWFDITGTPASSKPQLASTTDIIAGCKGDSPQYNTLQDFWVNRAQTLLHEWTHTTYFTGTQEK